MATHFSAWPRCVALLLAALGLCLPSSAQNQRAVRASAQLSSGVLKVGQVGYLNVTLENADDGRIVEVPTVAGVRFSKPIASGTDIRNGRMAFLTWTLSFECDTEGDFEIPPVKVEADGKRYETNKLRVTVVAELKGSDLGFLEVHASTKRVIEGQPFTVEILFGWDQTVAYNYANLSLPWWGALPGAIEQKPGVPTPGSTPVQGIQVNGEQSVSGELLPPRERSGRSFATYRLAKSFLPTRPGKLEFPTASLEFGRAPTLAPFGRGRRGETHFVQADAFELEVLALPTAGQPIDFSGAVGSFVAHANADARDVRVGDSIKLTVDWTGQGNLEYFHPPELGALDAFRAFRVFGSTEEKSFERRKVTYDLSPLSTEVKEIPPVPLSFFDPENERYASVATEPIPIRVRALERATGLKDEKHFERDIGDIDARPLAAEGADSGRARGQDLFLLAALVGVPLVGLGTRAGLRRRQGDPAAPLARRRRGARRTLERALAASTDAHAELGAFLEFLAARSGETPEAWQGRDLARWAASNRPALPAALVARAAAELARLEAAVFGSGARAEHAPLAALARELVEAGL